MLDSPSTISAPAPRAPAWIPIRSLSTRHRARLQAHLLSLSERDRYLRFGYAASDEQIERYVSSIDFNRDEVFGIFNRRLDLIATAHLAYMPPSMDAGERTAEFGVSVLDKARGRGLGAHLFRHAMLHARNRNVATLLIHALSENTAMLKIARRAGATVERDGPESQAWLRLPAETVASRLDELMDAQAAEFDYRWKVQARRFSWALGMWSDVKAFTRSTDAFNRLI